MCGKLTKEQLGIMSDILHNIRIIKAEGVMVGLTLSESKSELITSDHKVVGLLAVRNILQSVTHVDPRDAIVLGAPVGVDVIIDTVQVERVLTPGRTFEKSRHTQHLLCILKNCFSLSTLMYTNQYHVTTVK